MIIRVSEIEAEGLVVGNAAEFVAPFSDRSWRLDRVQLQVARDGVDVVVSGRIDATVPLVCSRCLEEFRSEVHPEVAARYVPKPGDHDVELGADDLDLDVYQNDELNLSALVETETSLALPMKPLCRPDCQGLCPMCGVNLNLTRCTCERRAPDPRLAPLRELAARLNH